MIQLELNLSIDCCIISALRDELDYWENRLSTIEEVDIPSDTLLDIYCAASQAWQRAYRSKTAWINWVLGLDYDVQTFSGLRL
jgi:hypothetical protein